MAMALRSLLAKRQAALLVTVLLTLGGCQSFPPPQSATVHTEQQVVVPFVSQDAYQCGPAALAMMLQWAGKDVSADALVNEVWLPERKGSLGIELRAAARSRGLMAYPVESAEALFQELQANRPVLVMQNLALPRWPKWHFAVVTGYQDQGDTVVLHSGTSQSDSTHWNRFIRSWARADQWGFTLVEAGQLPASAEPDALFRAISPLPNSAAFWPAAVDAFPQSGQLWFGYGNALWAEDKQEDARTAFEKAVRHAPELAAAWNNLAYAQQAAGDNKQARQSICQALSVSPNDSEIQDSARELGAQSCDVSPAPSAPSAASTPSASSSAASSGGCATN